MIVTAQTGEVRLIKLADNSEQMISLQAILAGDFRL
jgi:ATP phosphoribosyltransferase regulatory subunit